MDRVPEVHPDPPRHGLDGGGLQERHPEPLELSMIAKIIEISAKYRGFLILLAVGAIRRIQLDAIPDLSDPQVIVFTEWKGQSPTLIEDQVTYPIASSLLAAPKVAAVRGYSMFGMSFIYVLFEEGTDVYWSRTRVLEYMNGIKSKLL